MTQDILVFDRAAVRAHRERAARLPADARFLRREVRSRLLDRLNDVKPRFERVLDLGAADDGLPALLAEMGRTPWIVSLDPARGFAAKSPRAVVGEEEALPFAAGSFDLVVSTLGLHWTNDMPGAMLQIRRCLKEDGLFLAAFYGGETLWELREVLIEAELEIVSGVSPRVSPFADGRDAGALLQRAGLALPVVDSEILTVTYPNALALMQDLRAMGETSAVRVRPRGLTRRAVLLRAAEIYRERFGDESGRIPATFQVITMTGWAPAPTQPKPLRPGSATARLADALGASEMPAGEAAPPRRANKDTDRG